MSLLDDLRSQDPALKEIDDNTLKQAIRRQPQFRHYNDEQFESVVSGVENSNNEDRNSETAMGLVGDTIDAAQRGAYQVAQGAGDFAEEYIGIGESLGDFGREGAERQLEQMSPRAAEAIQQEIFESTGSGLWDFEPGEGMNPLTVMLQTASLAGEAVTTGFGAGTVARGGISLTGRAVRNAARRRAKEQGLDETAQQAAATQAAKDFAASKTAGGIKLGTYGAAETAINTGQIADGAYQEIMAMPDEELDQSEAFSETYWEMADENPDASVDDLRQRAREQMAEGSKSLVMRDPALLLTTGALGGYGGKVLDDLVTKGTKAGGGRLGAAVRQAAVQGATETGQGGMGQYSINEAVAEVGADPDRNPMEGVTAAGLSEGVIGGVMGGGAGAAAGRPRAESDSPQASEQPTESGDGDEGAAVTGATDEQAVNYDIPTVQRLNAAREQAAAQGGDALDQAMAAETAEQAEQATEPNPEQQAERQRQSSDIGNRIQMAMGELDELQNMSRGSSYEGQSRLRNISLVLDRAERAYEDGKVEQAGRLTQRAEGIASDLRNALQRSGSRERPMEGEIADPEQPQQPAGLLRGRQGQLPPGTGDSIRGESPQQFEARQRAQQDQTDTLNRQSLGRDDVIYGEGPTAGNANTGMDQPSTRDPRFTQPQDRAPEVDQPAQALQYRTSGAPFPSERAAMASGFARNAQRNNQPVAAVPVEGGFALDMNSSTTPVNQETAQPDAPEPQALQYRSNGRPFSTPREAMMSRFAQEANQNNQAASPVRVDGGFALSIDQSDAPNQMAEPGSTASAPEARAQETAAPSREEVSTQADNEQQIETPQPATQSESATPTAEADSQTVEPAEGATTSESTATADTADNQQETSSAEPVDSAQEDSQPQETETETSQEPADADETPKPKRRNKPLQYTGYSGEERSVRSYQEVGDYRIAKVHDNFYEVIDSSGQAVSQMAGPNGAAQEAARLNDLPATEQRYAIGQSDARPVSREAIEQALASSPELSGVTVIQSATELPPASIMGMALQGVNPRNVRGLFVGDQLYVIADNVDSVQEGISTAVHETVGHKGMRAVLGEDLERVMLNLYRNLPNSKEGREALREVRRDYPFLDPRNRKDRVVIGEEMVAHLLEKGHRPKAWQRAVAKIRELLRRIFPSVAWTYTDALALGERSRDYLRKQQGETQSSGEQVYALRAKQRANFEDQFDDFSDADRSAASKIGNRTPSRRVMDWYREHADRASTKIRQGMVDRYAALKEMDERLYGESALGENIQRSSWVLARMSNAANGALHAMLHNGRIKLNSQERIIEVQEGDSKGLGEVLGRLGAPAEIERFMGWIAGSRASKLAEEGRENLFDVGDIDAMKNWNRGQMADGRNREQVYEEVFKEFQEYRDDVLSIAEESGIISKDQREMWGQEAYVPFYRLSEEKGAPTGQVATSGLSRQQAYKRLKGGSQNVSDLLQNTMLNFNHLLDASLKNQAATQAIENAKELGMAEQVPESNRDTKTSTFVMQDGKKVFYEIDDPLVFSALTSLSHAGMNSTMMRIMRKFKRVFTNSVTITPQFIAANLLRDSMQATATNEVSKNALSNVLTGVKSYRDARTQAQMLASGGAFNFGHLYGTNPDELRAQMTRSMRNAKVVSTVGSGWGVATKPIDAVRAGWNWWGDVNNTAENANRAAIFQQNQDKGKLKAAFESRDLIDFSAHGAWPAVRILIDIVPFLNARIQGLDKIYRSGVKPGTNVLREMFGGKKANITDKQAAGRFWAVTGAVTTAAVALYLHNHDEEEYQKLEEWERDTYWHFFAGGSHFVLPKPFEVGAIATLAERFTQQFVDDEATGKLFAERLGHMMTDTFSFSPVPQMMQPALDIYANKDNFTGRPIESMGMDRLSPEMRKRYNTSKLGTGVSQLLNSTVGALGDPDSNPLALSPVQVDHLVEGYLGALGGWALGGTDTAARVLQGEDAPSKRWYEWQPIRRFYSNLNDVDPYTRYGSVFYQGLTEARRAYSDVKELRELGRLAEASERAESSRELMQLRPALNRAQRRMSTINKQIDMIRRSDVSGDVKRQRIDRLQAIKAQMQRVQADRILKARSNG